jgi:DNA-binding protein H-NS
LSGTDSTTMKGKIADGEARERLIIWVRRRMAELGITLDALAAAIQHDLDYPPLYRDARGNEWNGLGDMPDWLRAARNAGVSPDFFRIEPPAIAASENTDPRQLDLFG